ncbi:MAG: hypothetical protein R6V02_00275 [Candidatus Aminicenantes bacterium]
MKIIKTGSVIFFIMVLFTACAPGPNPMEGTPDAGGDVAGFWKGLWHGLIAPVTFIISIFTESVRFYDVHNNGFWYNFGFVVGAGLIFNGGLLGGRWAKNRD